ncbi:MAG: GTPase Era [bacterium]|jgi:GTP-binding protein Era|nr:GTPase Era [bacterium]
MRSGFVSFVGRPNVGKSTLLNAICGKKVSIVSDKPQTTRNRIRGVLTTAETQLIFVDTPGIHKAVSALGERVNATAIESTKDVDVVCLVIDATQTFGTGDKYVSSHIDMSNAVVILNKIDRAEPAKILKQLQALSALGAAEYFPISAKTGDGVAELTAYLASRMPEGELLYPVDMVTETPDSVWIAELVREQLLENTHEELPYSIATRVTEYEPPRIRCEIVVERESQKGMVIGKNGAMLKIVGTNVRRQLPSGTFLELAVVVDKNWQQRPERVERLGY